MFLSLWMAIIVIDPHIWAWDTCCWFWWMLLAVNAQNESFCYIFEPSCLISQSHLWLSLMNAVIVQKTRSSRYIFTMLSHLDQWQLRNSLTFAEGKKGKKRQKYWATAVPVPHLCPNSLTSGRKWDSTYQMRDPLQFFNLCFESCLILNEMKRLDVIFPLIKCFVIYNHNSPGMSLRN